MSGSVPPVRTPDRRPSLKRDNPVGPRRLLAMGLALALGVFGLQVAIHSTHHLAAHGAAAQCDVAAASAHVFAAGGDRPAVECALVSARERKIDTDAARVETPPLGTNQGRAPPATRF